LSRASEFGTCPPARTRYEDDLGDDGMVVTERVKDNDEVGPETSLEAGALERSWTEVHGWLGTNA
jgi:hypothetical protein